MNWINKILNNKTFMIILCVALLLAFYFNVFNLGHTIEGLENNTETFYGPNGGNATITTDSSGNVAVSITDSNGTTTLYTSTTPNATTYYGPDGGKAEVITKTNGYKTVVVTHPDGTTVVYTNDSNGNYNYNNNYDNYNHYTGEFENVTFYGPDGGTAQVVKTPDNNTIVITYKNGITEIYYIDATNTNTTTETYVGPNGNTAKIITNSSGQKAIEITFKDGSKIVYNPQTGNTTTYNSSTGDVDHYNGYNQDYYNTSTSYSTSTNTATGPYGNTVSSTTYTGPNGNTATTYDVNSYDYYSSLPPGIPRSQIPPGEEDKYILKSQIVPPVCPKCPDIQCPSSDKIDESKCPPCPACERCPEPSFDCVKMPNYNAFNPKTMPLPVLSDFSNFGM